MLDCVLCGVHYCGMLYFVFGTCSYVEQCCGLQYLVLDSVAFCGQCLCPLLWYLELGVRCAAVLLTAVLVLGS